MILKYTIIYLLLYQLEPHLFVYGGGIIEFHDTRCKFSPKYFGNFTVSTFNGTLSSNMHLKKALVPGFKTDLDFKIRLSNSKKYQTLFSYVIDVCAMVHSLKDTMFKKWFQSLMAYGNFMNNCPVVPGHYYLNNWKLEPKLMPPYLYPGDYRVKGRGYFINKKSKAEDFVVELEVDAVIK